MGGCSGKRPSDIGMSNNRLHPCPETPNCVSSYAADRKASIHPLQYTGDRIQAKNRLKQIILKEPRATLITETDDYLHIEFKSLIFRFVDDVEFYFPDNESIVHVRSASRVGYSDLGINKKRIEHIRQRFEK
ncbi:MAG: DUF1499 domain-containing protein [Proteobacteria bacterium]|nr:DUF1499 domain-containing protein [Pseudomonadota bacterium]